MNNNDRRVRKTKRALRDALAKLMMEKELHAITVRELTERADVHRATFYAHYQDIYDLFEQLESGVLSELDKIFNSDPSHSYDGVYHAIIDYVYNNTEIWHMLFGKHGNRNFLDSVCELVEQKYLSIWLYEENNLEISEEMRYLTTYHIQGCIAIIRHWVNSGFTYSKEQVAELIHKVNDHVEYIMI